jgi:hypothetical protein
MRHVTGNVRKVAVPVVFKFVERNAGVARRKGIGGRRPGVLVDYAETDPEFILVNPLDQIQSTQNLTVGGLRPPKPLTYS